MKKTLLAPVLLFCALAGSAQDFGTDSVPKNKKGHEILPRKGDIGLGFNTIPVLDAMLGTMNRATPFAGSANMVQYTNNTNNQITGKYFIGDKAAIRVRFGINTLSGSITNQVQDAKARYDASFGTLDDIAKANLMRVDDKMTFTKSNWLLSAGYEKRRGYRRLQGYYGAELGLGNTAAKQTASYGNAFSDLYPVQFTNNFNTLATTIQEPTVNGRVARTTEINSRGGFRIGLRGCIGMEYFVFSKISISAEYGWGYSVAIDRAVKTQQEVYNNGQKGPEVFTETVDTDSREVLRGFSVDNNNGNLFSLNNTLNGNTALGGGAGALTLIFHF
jgi:hypothetical protein